MKTVLHRQTPDIGLVEARSRARPSIGRFFGLSIHLAVMLVMAASTMEISVRSATLIEGTVKLPPPKPPPAASARYQQKAGAVATPDPPAGVVYLEGPFAGGPPASPGQMVIQKGFQFMPSLLPIQRGGSVEFPNKDEDYHHVFSYSKAKEFDLGRYRMDEKPAAIRFDKAGVVKVGCEIHDHMRAIILVLETPHFTKTTPDGKYRLELKDVPDGKYTLKAWINEKTVWEQPVEIKQGAALQVDFPAKLTI